MKKTLTIIYDNQTDLEEAMETMEEFFKIERKTFFEHQDGKHSCVFTYQLDENVITNIVNEFYEFYEDEVIQSVFGHLTMDEKWAVYQAWLDSRGLPNHHKKVSFESDSQLVLTGSADFTPFISEYNL